MINSVGVFGERIGQAIQKIHERNGAIFYAQTDVVKIIVRCL